MRYIVMVLLVGVLSAEDMTPAELEAHISGPVAGTLLVSHETYRHWALALPGGFPAGSARSGQTFEADKQLTLHIWTRGERGAQCIAEASSFQRWRDIDLTGLHCAEGELTGEIIFHAHESGDGTASEWPSHRWTLQLNLKTLGNIVSGRVSGTHAFALVDRKLTDLPDGTKRHVQEVLAERENRFLASAKSLDISVTGTMYSSAEERQAVQWPKAADWTHWAGSDGTMRGAAPDEPLIFEPAKARMVWRAEADLPIGGKGQVSRYGGFGASERIPSGGGASPVISDGKIYLYYYQPAGAPYVVAEEEKRAPTGYFIKDMWRTMADEHIACFDVVTGERLWEMVYPLAGMTFLHGKSSMINNTPAIGEGVIVVRSSSMRVFCLDKETGQERWQILLPGSVGTVKKYALSGEGAGGRAHPRAVTIAGGLAFVDYRSDLVALRLSDGSEAWKRSNVLGAQYTPQVWRKSGVTALITQSDDGVLRAIDHASGEDLWHLEGMTKHHYQTINNFLIGDRLLVQGPVIDYENKNDSNRIGRSISCYELSTSAATLAWQLPGDRYCWPHNGGLMMCALDSQHVAMFQGMTNGVRIDLPGLIVVDMETGTVTDETIAVKGGLSYMMSTLSSCGDLVISHDDISHSAQSFNGFQSRGDEIEPLWTNHHFGFAETSSYEVPTMNPFVAGRLFVRGAFGLHCYDFRQDQVIPRRIQVEVSRENLPLPVEVTVSQANAKISKVSNKVVISSVNALRNLLIRLFAGQDGNN